MFELEKFFGIVRVINYSKHVFTLIPGNMKKKLTLTIEESVKNKAKRFASRNNISLSEVIEKYLDTISREEEFQPEPGSWTESLYGSAKIPKEYEKMTYKQIKEKEIFKKYAR